MKGNGRYVEDHARRIRGDLLHGSDTCISHRDATRHVWYAYRIPRMDRICTSDDDEYCHLVRGCEKVDVYKDRCSECLKAHRTSRNRIYTHSLAFQREFFSRSILSKKNIVPHFYLYKIYVHDDPLVKNTLSYTSHCSAHSRLVWI